LQWPPHINLVYPFVAPEHLPKARDQIQEYLAKHLDQETPIDIELVQAGGFVQKNSFTVFLTDDGGEDDSPLVSLRTTVLQALGQPGPIRSTPHLTIGQTQGNPLLSQSYLLSKAQRLPKLHFRAGTLAILIRERTTGTQSTDYMRLYGTIDIGASDDIWRPHSPDYWVKLPNSNLPALRPDGDENQQEPLLEHHEVRDEPALCFDPNERKWSPYTYEENNEAEVKEVTVSSYNVLVDTEYPPDHDRDPLVVDTILSDQAMADVLVLQEVSDDFLSYLLSTRQDVAQRYPFVSHGPPSQSDLGPLPSLRNVVILSHYPFRWHSVPFHRKHKSALIAQFTFATSSSRSLGSLVVAGVHLTAGLTDGSVATKKAQMGTLTRYLERHYGNEPWVIAGDFNLVTSTYTIETSVKDESISSETVSTLATIEAEIREAGLSDAWSVARVEGADETSAAASGDLFEGEEGATFDPQNNRLAAGTTTTSHDRPQRYDRILFRSQDSLRVNRFNHFGVPEMIDGVQVVASDHYGVRAKLRMNEASLSTSNEVASSEQPTVEYKRAAGGLTETMRLQSVLEAHGMFPDDNQVNGRRDAFASLQHILLDISDDEDSAQPDIPLVIVPVGSYALGVWTIDSDIDCLCIGTISSKTFFRLARQRLNKAESKGVRILRKVEANTGTMLELSVNGILMDLQYCPAPQVVER
jgi:endonuclease/exonuclease/phosphatase family metal-dependent hydrolase